MMVQSNLDSTGAMLRSRGLEPGGRVQRLFTMECAKHMDPYVPMRDSTLKNTRVIGVDRVTYPMRWAHYQYTGDVLLTADGRAFARRGEIKPRTGGSLTYHGAPMRGKLWDVRMWGDKKKVIVKNVAAAAGGRPG